MIEQLLYDLSILFLLLMASVDLFWAIADSPVHFFLYYSKSPFIALGMGQAYLTLLACDPSQECDLVLDYGKNAGDVEFSHAKIVEIDGEDDALIEFFCGIG